STNPKQNPAIQTIQKINHLNDFLVLGSLSPNMPPITLYLCLSLSFFFFSVCFIFFLFFTFSFLRLNGFFIIFFPPIVYKLCIFYQCTNVIRTSVFILSHILQISSSNSYFGYHLRIKYIYMIINETL